MNVCMQTHALSFSPVHWWSCPLILSLLRTNLHLHHPVDSHHQKIKKHIHTHNISCAPSINHSLTILYKYKRRETHNSQCSLPTLVIPSFLVQAKEASLLHLPTHRLTTTPVEGSRTPDQSIRPKSPHTPRCFAAASKGSSLPGPGNHPLPAHKTRPAPSSR